MKKLSHSFVTGAVALVFAVLGYQTALLVHYAAVSKIVADRDRPDTVYVSAEGGFEKGMRSTCENQDAGRTRPTSGKRTERGKSSGMGKRSESGKRLDAVAGQIRKEAPPAELELFRFNPNTVSVEEMVRLGFTRKQAESIDHYRAKGGKFRRKEDFARSYTVSENLYKRLEAYIDIPLVDINAADSAAFDALPGIGGYFARKMVEHRERLHGYSYPEQLMDIYHFDSEKFDKLKDLICVGTAAPYPLWSLPADSLRRHPYIGNFSTARSIVFYREHNSRDKWTIEGLFSAGILTREQAGKLLRCSLE